MKTLRFSGLWGARGWIEPAFVEIDDKGIIRSVSGSGDEAKAERVEGWALPGVPNTHSHAFQFAMAGRAEHLPAGQGGDDFWSWREAMYELALGMTAERLRNIAAQLYASMLARGFTSVVEFHYLHHAPDGKPYPRLMELAEAITEAATLAGIRLTLVPVHYRLGDFGKPATARQRRFLFDGTESYLKFAEKCAVVARKGGHGIGGGVHSLRASPPEDTIRIFRELPAAWPRHLHIAEQLKEVTDAQAALGKRPVEWLLDNVALDSRFHLVHCTHVTAAEASGVARAGAHVVLCPTTEGNLGDGIFPLKEFHGAGGRFSVGTDSHVGIDPWEELRWADYGQRLRLHRRNPLCAEGGESGELLLRSAVQSGGRAMGRETDSFLDVGDALDAVVLDGTDPLIAAASPQRRISVRVFAGAVKAPVGTLVGGRWVVRQGKHLKDEALTAGFLSALD